MVRLPLHVPIIMQKVHLDTLLLEILLITHLYLAAQIWLSYDAGLNWEITVNMTFPSGTLTGYNAIAMSSTGQYIAALYWENNISVRLDSSIGLFSFDLSITVFFSISMSLTN